MSNDSNRIDLDFDFEQVANVSNVFFEESKDILEDLDALIMKFEDDPFSEDLIGILFRKVHTLKGSVGAIPGGQLLGSLAHEFEALIEKIRKEKIGVSKEAIDLFLQSSRLLKILADSLREARTVYPEELSEVIETINRFSTFNLKPTEEPVRHKVSENRKKNDDEEGAWLSREQMADLLKVGSEFVVLRNYLQMMNQAVNFRSDPEGFERRQIEFAQNLSKLTDFLQEQIVKIQKVTVTEAFQGVHAVVRQVSTELRKQVVLHPIGFDLAIDKNLATDLYQSVVHILRNSLDHGLETPEERIEAGKSPEGHITLAFEEKNGVIIFKVSDDGRGLNRERIIKRAIENGLISEEQSRAMDDSEVWPIIMKPGFSTKDKISTISGRGIGMDVVKDSVERYGGKIEMKSVWGKGLEQTMHIPVPRNIMVEKVLLCESGDFQFAIPLLQVARIVSCSELHLTEVDGLRYCQFDNETVPLLNYSEIVQLKSNADLDLSELSSVFLRTKEGVLALIVDKVDRQADLVIRVFDKLIKEVKGFKGSSVLADDKVTYVVDPRQLILMIRGEDAALDLQEEAA